MPNLVVFESTTPIPSESWVKLVLDGAPSVAGGRRGSGVRAELHRPGRAGVLHQRLRLHRAVRSGPPQPDGPAARSEGRGLRRCGPDHRRDRPGRRKAARQGRKPAPARRDFALDESRFLTIEDAGYPDAAAGQRATTSRSMQTCALPTGRSSATRGSDRSRHGISEPSPALETATACGRPAVETCCRSTRGTSRNVRQWSAALAVRDLMPTLLRLQPRFNATPEGEGAERRLGGAPDRIQSHGLDLTAALNGSNTGPRLGGRRGGRSDRTCAAVWRVARPRVGDPGDQPRHHGQGQPAEHARLRHSSRHGCTSRRRQGVDRQAGQPDLLDRDDERGWRSHRPANGATQSGRMVRVLVHRHRREGWRHRLHRQRLERRRDAVGFRTARSTSAKRRRCCVARCSAIGASTVSAKR